MNEEKPLRILHVGNHTLPCLGGVENVIWQTAQEQVRLGHAVSILVFDTCTSGKERLPSHEKKEGVDIHRIPQHGWSFYRIPSPLALIKHARGNDVIHAHGIGAWFDLLAILKPLYSGVLILNTHGGFFHTQNRAWIKKIYHRLLLPLFLTQAKRIHFDSASDATHFPYVSPEQKRVIPNGINPVFEKAAKMRRTGHNGLFIGRLSKNKRVDRLIEAFCVVTKRFPSAHLHIVGSDWEGLNDSLLELARQKDINKKVVFHGAVSDKKLLEIVGKCRIFVSASEYEGFGVSVLEAMMGGCIPLLNDIPTFREFADDGRGVVVSFSNPETAAEAWIALLKETPVKQAVRRKKGLAYVASFSVPAVTHRIIESYREAREGRIP